jgi:hypothetical protein
MRLYKLIDVDVTKYLEKLHDSQCEYTDDERFKLNQLYTNFSLGYFHEAIEFSRNWSREEREMIPQEIWDILYDVAMGGIYAFQE